MRRGKNGQFIKEYLYDDNTIETSLSLPREYRKNCKLTDKQIKEIQNLYSTGKFSSRELGREYGVSKQQILYWVNGEEFRKKEWKRRRNYINNDPNRIERRKIYRQSQKKLIANMKLKERVRVRKYKKQI